METPVLCSRTGIDPHIEALRVEGGLYLSTSPELHMKRLLAAGLERIFQVTRAFRAEEKGRLHHTEFAILEWYAAGQTYRELMEDAEELVLHAAAALERRGIRTPARRWPRPFPRLAVDEAFAAHAGWVPSREFSADRFFLDLVEKVEGPLARMGAVFLHDFPAALASLARKSASDPFLSERVELYLEGVEISNGFTELTDRVEQEDRFLRANRERLAAGRDAYPLDERFLEALESGIPPCAGNALGVDRLLMVLAGAGSIDDVIAFRE